VAVNRGRQPAIGGSRHLEDLIADADRLVARVVSAPAAARAALAVELAEAACHANLGLEGADPASLPSLERARSLADAAVGAAGADGADGAVSAPERPGTWLDAMGIVKEAPDEVVQAFELLGIEAGLASDDLAGLLASDPVPALAELHRRLTSGLVGADNAGAHRRTDQAVHDASLGRIIYFATEPAAIADELELLGAWVATAGVREHGLVTSGVLHHGLLRIHPYEAANGRLARIAGRLVLRTRGLDPDGLAAPEPVLARDPLGYHEEVAGSLRRRDLTTWLERWGEAVTDGLRSAARALSVLPGEVPARAAAFVSDRSDDGFTLADYRSEVGITLEDARADLFTLLDEGRISRVTGSRGLRFRCDERPHQLPLQATVAP
jgi:hypothetical protein